MPNVFHAQDAEMWGRDKFSRWQRDFMAKWEEPETVMIEAAWKNIPEQYRAIMRTMMDPDMRSLMEGFDNGNNLAK